MTGNGNNEWKQVIFKPNESLTREQFAQILYSAQHKPEVTYTERFTDVADGQWYTSAILWAAEKGVTSGYSDDIFGVSDKITREQLAAMLYKYAEVKGYDVTAGADLDAFKDASAVQEWAWKQMQWAIAKGIISGKPSEDGTLLDPAGAATRAECAAMVKAFFENLA